jgi:hypothetical protein
MRGDARDVPRQRPADACLSNTNLHRRSRAATPVAARVAWPGQPAGAPRADQYDENQWVSAAVGLPPSSKIRTISGPDASYEPS